MTNNRSRARRATPAKPAPGGEAAARDVALGDLTEHTGYVIRRVQLLVFQNFIRTLAPLGIRPGEFAVLTVIGANPGLKQAEIAEALAIKRTNLVAVLHDLEARGLARRVAAAGDRRAHAVRLTARGGTLLARCRALAAAHEARVAASVGDAGKRRLLALLHRMEAGLAAAPGEPEPTRPARAARSRRATRSLGAGDRRARGRSPAGRPRRGA